MLPKVCTARARVSHSAVAEFACWHGFRLCSPFDRADCRRRQSLGRAVCHHPRPVATHTLGVCSMGTLCVESDTVQEQTPEAAVVQAAEEAAEQEAEAKAELQEQAAKLLGDAGKAFRKGEQEYGKWVLLAGEKAWEYTQVRMRLTGMGRKTQEAAYSALEGEFNKWASTKVRVDTIVRASMACQHFTPHLPAKVTLPYGHWRDAWCQLVELQGDGWVIPALVEEEAVAEFKRATEAGMSREESLDVVKAVQRKLARMQADLAQQAAAEQRKA